MKSIRENYLVDKKGHKIGVFLDMKVYQQIIEDLEDIKAYDAAKKFKGKAIPFSLAVQHIERKCVNGHEKIQRFWA